MSLASLSPLWKDQPTFGGMYQNKGNASGGNALSPPPYTKYDEQQFYTGKTYQVCDNIRHIAIMEQKF